MTENTANKNSNEMVFWLATVTGIVCLALLMWLVDLKWLHGKAQDLPGSLVLLLTIVLPLFGVPVSFLFALMGAKFGHLGGVMFTALAIALHLLGSWWIAHSWLKHPLETLVRKTGRTIPTIPPEEAVPVCLLVALVPGVSYTLKNYLLVLGNVRFKPFFWTLLPAHMIHATLAIFFGDFTGAMTTPKIIFLSVYALLLIGLGHYVVRRLKRRKNQREENPQLASDPV